jgi:hypothetical protein
MGKTPTPATVTRTQFGAQAFVSEYVTVKVKVVAVVPEAGLAVPERRDGVCAGGHAGLAPNVAVVASRVAMVARRTARRRTMRSAS